MEEFGFTATGGTSSLTGTPFFDPHIVPVEGIRIPQLIANSVEAPDPAHSHEQKDDQCDLAAAEQRRTRISRTTRRKIIEELCQAPHDQDHGPVQADDVTDAEFREAVMQQEKDADQDDQQSSEN